MAKIRARELVFLFLIVEIIGIGMITFGNDTMSQNSINAENMTKLEFDTSLTDIATNLQTQATQKYTGIGIVDTLIVNVFAGSTILFSVPDIGMSMISDMQTAIGITPDPIVSSIIAAIILFVMVFSIIELATRSEI